MFKFLILDAGQSRSASFLVGFIMGYLKLSFEESLKFALHSRPQISINKGFQEQLLMYEKNQFKISPELLKESVKKFQPKLVEWKE